MTQAFLNEPTIEEAHRKYLTRWSFPTVQAAWNGRRPSIQQFTKRYGEAHAARQAFLKGAGVNQAVLEDRRIDDVQNIAEAVIETLAKLSPPRFAELSADETPQPQETSEPEVRTEQRSVKPKNMDKLPNANQLYFYLHRAIEKGHNFVTIPVKRGLAADGIGLIKGGLDPVDTILELRKRVK